MLQIVVSLNDKYKGIIYDHHIFIEETTGFKNIFLPEWRSARRRKRVPSSGDADPASWK
jgi:hypothetical protein